MFIFYTVCHSVFSFTVTQIFSFHSLHSHCYFYSGHVNFLVRRHKGNGRMVTGMETNLPWC